MTPGADCRTLFHGAWVDVCFIHYQIEPRILQPQVPFELDLRDGRAYVSLVAFAQQKLRFAFGGPLTAWVGGLMGNHDFLNVRTYIREQGESGIHFLAEWVPNRLATWLAPPLYGLPYRLGQLAYDETGGRVTCTGTAFQFQLAGLPRQLVPAVPGSLDAFLLERYLATTQRGPVRRRFRVMHEPWPQSAVDVRVDDVSLLRAALPWWEHAQYVGANYSPGVPVSIGRPERIR